MPPPPLSPPPPLAPLSGCSRPDPFFPFHVVRGSQPHLESADDTLDYFLSLALFLLFGPGLTYALIRYQVVTPDKYTKMAQSYHMV